ncbi:uncharacterized protein LOC130727007 [Lotus japonicus]|uniref:uncharacterized protein LOC130727007 n=1 Tax=Lotus japonicus TaxID=34305 RepID=UPI00258445BA|nr:uncharacterized protein LOC130727007 [Lotus japonicus]
MATDKIATVADVGIKEQDRWKWDVSFRRKFFDWELEQHQRFLKLTNSVVPIDEDDFLYWKGDNAGLFSVKGLCRFVEDKKYGRTDWQIPKSIKQMIPAKVGVFMWQLQRDRVATKACLMTRGMVLPEEGMCNMCTSNVESSAHLFVHCEIIWQFWCRIMQREGQNWVVPQDMKSLLLEWGNWRIKTDKILWDIISYALCWSIWLERNNTVFNDKTFCAESVWDLHLARI